MFELCQPYATTLGRAEAPVECRRRSFLPPVGAPFEEPPDDNFPAKPNSRWKNGLFPKLCAYGDVTVVDVAVPTDCSRLGAYQECNVKINC